MAFAFLFLTYSTCDNLRFIHAATNGIISFLWLSNIPLHVYTHTHRHTHTPHVFFIHSSSDGYLACFHVLATVNSVASYTKLSFELLFSPDVCPGMGLLDHMATLFLVF